MLNVRLTSDRPPVSEIAVYLAVAVDVFDGILCCAVSPPPPSPEVSWMRSGTELSQFLILFLPTLLIRQPDKSVSLKYM